MKQHTPLHSAEVLEKLLIHLKISANKLAQVLDLNSNVSIYHIKNGKHNISSRLAKKITAVFPEINYQWLLTGHGTMLNNDTHKTATPLKPDGKKAAFEEILDHLTIDEIVTYIHKYEDKRFARNETYKMFMEIRNQRKLLEYLERELKTKDEVELKKPKKA